MRVVVISTRSPELHRLASHLAENGKLARLVVPRDPAASVAAVLRRPPAPTFRNSGDRLPILNVVGPEGAAVSLALRAPVGRRLFQRRLYWPLVQSLNRRLSRAGIEPAAAADIVVASHNAALEVFAALPHGPLKVLNYQSVHHRTRAGILRHEECRRSGFRAERPTVADGQLFARYDAECRLADLLLVGSEFARQSMIDQGLDPARVHAVPYGVDAARFRPPAEERRTSPFGLLFVGRIDEGKGVSYLLEAYERFRKPDSSLTLIGTMSRGAGGYGRFRGLFRHVPHLPHDRLPPAYQAASVFVLTSLFEGLGLAVLEAMAAGLPVIVSNRGPSQVVRDGIDGFVVDPHDVDAIVDRLERLYRDPALRRRMGDHARRQATNYTWRHYARRVEALLLERAGAN